MKRTGYMDSVDGGEMKNESSAVAPAGEEPRKLGICTEH